MAQTKHQQQAQKRTQTLLDKVEIFLDKHDMEATTFGVLAVRDGKLVHDMRKGDRVLRRKTLAKIRAFMLVHALAP